ncbi:MAG: polysaccharide biosynthesis/export family protein [Archangiaceae bacterium]|nr:polysaccharide biosynthesis/export family protein [Archangiaceae bacterium]
MKRAAIIAALAVLGGAACRHDTGAFVWVDDFKQEARPDGEYVIRPGDLVSVRVYGQDNMSARSRVRTDGKISLPFLNDVTAAGFTPVVLSAQLQTRLKDFINNPMVTISLEELRPVPVSVLGEVPRPAVYTLDPNAGVLQAVAAAGGFTNFAGRDLYVLRASRDGSPPQRIRFDYDAVAQARGSGASFKLRPGDVLIVE